MVGDFSLILSDRGDIYTLSDVTSLIYLLLIPVSDMRSKILTYAQPPGWERLIRQDEERNDSSDIKNNLSISRQADSPEGAVKRKVSTATTDGANAR